MFNERIVVTALASALVIVGGTSASAQNAPAAPKSCVTWAPNPLPPATAGKPYLTRIYVGSFWGADPRISGLPAGLKWTAENKDQTNAGVLEGTPAQKGSYTIRVGSAAPFCIDSTVFQLTVREVTPPTISAFTVTPDTLRPAGGDVTVTVQVSDNVGVSRVLSSRTRPDGTGDSGYMKLVVGNSTNGTWTMKWPMPSNGSTTAVTWVIKTWALNGDNLQTRAAQPRTVVVLGQGNYMPPVLRK